MSDTVNLGIAYLEAAQSQKHVTMNQALSAYDILIQLAVLDRDLTAPPVSPVEGERYLVATPATAAWAGQEGDIAAYQGGAWVFYTPRAGWYAWVVDEAIPVFHDGTAWSATLQLMQADVVNSSLGARTGFRILEEEHVLASAATSDTVIQIPDRAIVHAVSVRVTSAVTGATSYDCGIAGETGKYGGTLGIAEASTNIGATGPTAFYADTAIRFTANGGNFTGGTIRVAIHYMALTAPV